MIQLSLFFESGLEHEMTFVYWDTSNHNKQALNVLGVHGTLKLPYEQTKTSQRIKDEAAQRRTKALGW